jgi:hypothetical protein
MRNSALWLALSTLLLFGCAQHSKAWDDAWAQCQADSFEALDAGGDIAHDQRSEWFQNYINSCMKEKGFTE